MGLKGECGYEWQIDPRDPSDDPGPIVLKCEKCEIEEEFIRVKDAQLMCLEGHVINDAYFTNQYENYPHCSECGNPTIYKCPECKCEIPGNKLPLGVYKYEKEILKTRNNCIRCSKPYPWAPKQVKSGTVIKSQFHDLKDLTWAEVKMAFVSNTEVNIKARDVLKKNVTFIELGFKKGNTNKAGFPWVLLKVLFARSNGKADLKTHPLQEKDKEKFKQHLTTIRKRLKSYFGIKSDPFKKYSTKTHWETAFVLTDSTTPDSPGKEIDLQNSSYQPEYYSIDIHASNDDK
jgi:hypothetical protein